MDILTVSHCGAGAGLRMLSSISAGQCSGCPAAAGKLAGLALCCCWRQCSSPEDLGINTAEIV